MSANALPRRSRAGAAPRTRPRALSRNTGRNRPRARAGTFGRAASLPSYIAVAFVGALLCAIVTLQIQALRANMAAGRIDRDRRVVTFDTVNLRAQIAKQYPRSKVDAFAADNGMVLPPPNAYQLVTPRSR